MIGKYPDSSILNSKGQFDDDFDYVFIIGAPRTGTTSLSSWLNDAGINTLHYFPDKIDFDGHGNFDEKFSRFKKFIIESEYKGFSDHPTRFFWQDLVEKFPKSRFILTVRESIEKWKTSFSHYFNSIKGNHDISSSSIEYLSENNIIFHFFHKRGLPLLILNIDTDSDKNSILLRNYLGIKEELGPIPRVNSKNENSDLSRQNNDLTVASLVGSMGLGIHSYIPFDPDAGYNTILSKYDIKKPYVLITSPGLDLSEISAACFDHSIGYPAEFLNSDFWKSSIQLMPFLKRPRYNEWVAREFGGVDGSLGLKADIYRIIKQQYLDNWFTDFLFKATYIFIEPEDLVSQAIAFYMNQMGINPNAEFFQQSDYQIDNFNPDLVLKCLKEILRQQLLTELWLKEKQIKPIVIKESQFSKNYTKIGSIISKNLGINTNNSMNHRQRIISPSENTVRYLIREFRNSFPWIDNLLEIKPTWSTDNAHCIEAIPEG